MVEVEMEQSFHFDLLDNVEDCVIWVFIAMVYWEEQVLFYHSSSLSFAASMFLY
jgi:hypothetical protein